MSKRNPLFSPLSCGIALVLILGLIAVLIVMGGRVFSPGPLTAVHPQNRSLQGFTNHADFENECSRCHVPLLGPTADRCLACHLTVADQLRTHSGLHSFLTGVSDCATCHSDHLGRDVRITRLNVLEFPHQEATGFPLEGVHAVTGCLNCHTDHQFKNTPRDCYGCHILDDAHNGELGTECSVCHTSVGWEEATLEEHPFPINHKNQGRPLECQVCHPNTLTAYTCYNCHEHNPAEMEHQHLEKGIREFQNCSSCHPTGGEHEE